ncbi:MAG: type I methionyl aminopeptidase [Deltaproteobacteria bacterium]|nr:type I methionyl aminopeptidase [Deltaproteobacteria bacterium]
MFDGLSRIRRGARGLGLRHRDYAAASNDGEDSITIKSGTEIDAMRAAGRLAAKTLVLAGRLAKPGVTTAEIDEFVHQYTIDNRAIPAPLNYKGFPKSVCTSINEVVCHGIPKKGETLRDGDIINIDVTSILDGFHGDTSRTFLVGNVAAEAKQLVDVTWECLMRGVAEVKPGGRIRDIGGAIQDHAEKFGYGVVREYVGHGIGRVFHEGPQVPHYRANGKNPRLRLGMTFTIEPMINLGTHETVLDDRDGWTVRTADGKLSAQHEHTILVTEDGHEVLTDASALD